MLLGKDGILTNANKPMTVTDIQSYIGKGRTKTSQYLNKFSTLGILEPIPKGRTKSYRVNPQYHILGKHPKSHTNLHFVKLYKNKLNELIDILKLNELGFIYKALSLCHYNEFYLVHNPNEPDTRNLKFINRIELGEIMNENVDNITKIVKSLGEKGVCYQTPKVVSYRIHPHIVRPLGSIPNQRIIDICNEFEAHKKEALRRKTSKLALY